MEIEEGYLSFLDFKTYYRITNKKGKKAPVIFLHGGPGSTHNYFEVFDSIVKEVDRPFIMYDQLGCGKSSIDVDEKYFNKETWIMELINLRKKLKLDKVHILGQSWGGMMLLSYMIDKNPKGVLSIILSSTLHSSMLWKEEQYRRISYMDKKYRDAISKAEKFGDYNNEIYLEAVDIFMKKYAVDIPDENSIECLRRKKISGTKSYIKAWGQNEFMPTGNLSSFDYTDRLNKIKTKTLITSGAMDLSSPYIDKIMHDKIYGSKWELFQYSRHMPFIDEMDKYFMVFKEWLDDFI